IVLCGLLAGAARRGCHAAPQGRTADAGDPAMTLLSRVDAAAPRVWGAVAGVSTGGVREVAAVGVADVDTGLRLTPSTRLRVASLSKPAPATGAVRDWHARG